MADPQTAIATTTRIYDNLDRLREITTSAGSQGVISRDLVEVWNGFRPQKVITQDGSYWMYGYDGYSRLESGKKHWSDGSLVAGQQFEYEFDDAGNRKSVRRESRVAGYTPKTSAANQYVSREVPGFVDVIGTAHPLATVTANNVRGQPAGKRRARVSPGVRS